MSCGDDGRAVVVNLVALGVAVYVLAQLAIGVWTSRRVQSESDYLLAGRSLGPGLAIFSLFATWFGAETCLGAAGAIYSEGLSGGRADPFGYAACMLLMGVVFAARLRATGLTTLADLFRVRFGTVAEKLVVLALVPGSILWGAAQIRALGQVISVTTTLDLGLTIGIAALVVVAYTVFGGLRADVTTDFMQGIALMIGLALLLGAAVTALGGPAEAWARMTAARPALAGAPAESRLVAVEAWVVPILGSVTAQELAVRVLACRTPAVARGATIAASGLYLFVGLIPVALGLLGATLLPGLDHAEQVIPRLAGDLLGPGPRILLYGALVAAILSTVDSNLLSASSLVAHNLVLPRWRSATERQRVLVARIGVVVAGVIAFALATGRERVYDMVEEASAFGGGGLVVAMTFGLFTRFGGWASAVAAIVAGMAVQTAGSYVLGWSSPMTISVIVALAAYVVVALTERRAGDAAVTPGEALSGQAGGGATRRRASAR